MTLLIAYILKCKTVCHLDALFMMQSNSKDSLQNDLDFLTKISVPPNIRYTTHSTHRTDMGKMKPKASKQSSRVTRSFSDPYGPDKQPDGYVYCCITPHISQLSTNRAYKCHEIVVI